MGTGFTIERLRDPRIEMSEHEEAAAKAFERAQEVVRSGNYDMVVLDEILGSITANLVTLDQVMSLIREKPPTPPRADRARRPARDRGRGRPCHRDAAHQAPVREGHQGPARDRVLMAGADRRSCS